MMRKMSRSPKIVNENTQQKNREGKSAPKLHCMRKKMENVDVWPNGHAYWVLTCPKSQKRFSPNSNFLPILFPSPCNNYFNQFLAELNDWVNEKRKVVDSLMGLPLTFEFSPLASKVKYFPLLIFRKIMPLSHYLLHRHSWLWVLN